MAYFSRTHERARWGFATPSLLFLVYIGVGLVVAATRSYFENVSTLERVVEVILAVVLWPLVLLGIDMRID